MFSLPFPSIIPWILLQQNPHHAYSIALVVICLLIAIGLWLPDVWKARK